MQSGEIHIHERFFRHIWCNQYLRTAELRTTDGRLIVVSDPGTLNPFGGPDVRDATIVIGKTTYVGHVEIHRSTNDWPQHGHHTDPAYNGVILHVVLHQDAAMPATVTASGRTVPVLVLESFLQEPLQSLLQQIVSDETTRAAGDIPCRPLNRSVAAPFLEQWIDKLAQERLEMKIRHCDNRLRELAISSLRIREPWHPYRRPHVEGFPEEIPMPEPALPRGALSNRSLWEQVLYEGFMDGLGYSRNRRPFLRLAQIASLDMARTLGIANDLASLNSLLFGVSGLLPRLNSIADPEVRKYVGQLRRLWARIRKAVRCEQLHEADWHFFPTRPGNFPTVRIAAAAGLIQSILAGDLFRKSVRIVGEPETPRVMLRALRTLLHIPADPFWTSHYHFDQPRRQNGVLIGAPRVDDLIANTVIPLSLYYARMFHDLKVREGALALYEHFPPLASNRILRTMEKQLLRGKVALNTMKVQQGVIQLHTAYCKQARCSECEIGRVVF